LSGKAKRENFQFLENSNIELIDEIDRVVKLYVNSNVDSSSRLRLLNDINLAGKQRHVNAENGNKHTCNLK